jgi:DUF3103 family protein
MKQMLLALAPMLALAAPPKPAATDAFLERTAVALARALESSEVREVIKREVGRKFDGDFEVLYRDLANARLSDGSTFRLRLADAASPEAFDRQAAALPQLQVAVPVHYQDWDTQAMAPLVAYVPTAIAEADLKEVRAFDAKGGLHLLDATNPPDVPVVVIGLNERTDIRGNLVQPLAICPDCDPGGGGGGGGGGPDPCAPRTHAFGDKEIFHQFILFNDHEPWIKGSAEPYGTWAFPDNPGVRGQFMMFDLDDEGTWYTPGFNLFFWQSFYGQNVLMALFEKDGTNLGTIRVSLGGFNYTLNIFDADDAIGMSTVGFPDPNCGQYDTGDASFRMRHAAP